MNFYYIVIGSAFLMMAARVDVKRNSDYMAVFVYLAAAFGSFGEALR